MEENKLGESDSSMASDLFDPPPESSSSDAFFGSVFASSRKGLGTESLPPSGDEKLDVGHDCSFNAKLGGPGHDLEIEKVTEWSMSNREMGTFNKEQKAHPCHLSSSIYYGGRDIYSHTQNISSSDQNPPINKDGADDDAGSASRGNWWQGSLYY